MATQNSMSGHWDGILYPSNVQVSGPFSGVRKGAETSTPTPILELPDLVVKEMRIELEGGGDCNFHSTQLGVRVIVSNIGFGNTGPFVVDVNNAQQTGSGELAVNGSTSLWFPGYVFGKNTAFVDATSQVAEQNETNNQVSQNLGIPTLPAPCTPTPGPAVGGISLDPGAGGSAGGGASALLVALAGATAGAIALALGGAAWWARGRARIVRG